MKRYTITVFVAAGMLLGAAAFAGADTICSSLISNTTINGDLVVPSGKSCELDGVVVLRNV